MKIGKGSAVENYVIPRWEGPWSLLELPKLVTSLDPSSEQIAESDNAWDRGMYSKQQPQPRR
jgi:hypothetical protein